MKKPQFSNNALKKIIIIQFSELRKNKLSNGKIQILDSSIAYFKGEIDGSC